MKSVLVIHAFLAVVVMAWPRINGASITLNPVADTILSEELPDNNFGALGVLRVGGNGHRNALRSLLKFDIANRIPSNATITAVSLNFIVTAVPPGGGQNSWFRLHRFLAPWTEGIAGPNFKGFPASVGETSWNSQFHLTNLWSSPGTTAGVEYSTAASASVFMQGMNTYTFSTTPEIIADVQAWVSGTASNYGWIMVGADEETPATARRIASREDASRGPWLVVDYTVPSKEPKITSVSRNGNNLEIRFTVPSNSCYEVQLRDSLTLGTWTGLTNFCAANQDLTALAVDPITRKERFYRLRISELPR